MVANGLRLLETVFSAVVSWFSDLMAAIGGRPYVIAGFMILLVVSLLLIPMRGNAMDSFGDLTSMQIHKEKQGYFSKSRNHKQQELKREMRRNRK